MPDEGRDVTAARPMKSKLATHAQTRFAKGAVPIRSGLYFSGIAPNDWCKVGIIRPELNRKRISDLLRHRQNTDQDHPPGRAGLVRQLRKLSLQLSQLALPLVRIPIAIHGSRGTTVAVPLSPRPPSPPIGGAPSLLRLQCRRRNSP